METLLDSLLVVKILYTKNTGLDGNRSKNLWHAKTQVRRETLLDSTVFPGSESPCLHLFARNSFTSPFIRLLFVFTNRVNISSKAPLWFCRKHKKREEL
jgi:hypothetical protein